jgi:tRNA 5-methylaminomethyl-2-thiouridine biosynthesis bifunctional protein
VRFPRLAPAQLQQRGDTPFSTEYADKYYSEQDGLAESRFTFLEGNNLPENWRGKKNYTIAELGFGTGLNFFAAWLAWQQDPQRSKNLTFISVERSPLSVEHFARLAQRWPELAVFVSEFVSQYPTKTIGHHWLSLQNGTVNVLLCFGDVEAIMPEWQLGVDTWFLDGFSPSRNPAMWSTQLCKIIARNSHIGASFATFTAASAVRKALLGAGFTVQKTNGFAGKRERLIGQFFPSSPKQATAIPRDSDQAVQKQYWIIGGGIAALSLAKSLVDMGFAKQVHIVAAQHISAASHNPAAVVLPQLSSELTTRGYLHFQAYQYALNFYQDLQNQCGEIEAKFFHQYSAYKQLAHAANNAEQQQMLARSLQAYQVPDDVAELTESGLFYYHCGVINGAQLCDYLRQYLLARGVTWHDEELIAEAPQQLILTGDRRITIAQGDSLIYCLGAGSLAKIAQQSQQQNPLNCHMTRGQMNCLQATADSQQINQLMARDTYITPSAVYARSESNVQQHYLGSTFNKVELDSRLSHTEAELLEQSWRTGLAHYPEEMKAIYKALEVSEPVFAALRLHTADRMPLLGPIPEWMACQKMSQAQQDQLRSSKPFFSRAADHYTQRNRWIFSGLGAHGFTLAPLLAHSLGSLMTHQQPQILQKTILRELHPLWHQLKLTK